ncbi:Transcriptional regulatory protein GlnR [Geodia barretti]|uniref:Transcriptional regulatory protein GlnR n=1 Tax=Geodia barretti TaxID=519541 RepID=A0AA35W4N9_GEOBA|nr:Transcriptional regulatory protein GlnR [Geodia barretti]
MLLDAHEESTGLLPQTVLLAAEGCDALDAPLSALRSSGIVELVELDGSSLEARIEEVTPSLVIAGPGVNSAIIGALARKKSISRILPPFLRFVTSTETEEDDLYLGFDDFVVASCSAAELEKRIRRLTNASRSREPSHLTAGPITIDAEKYRVTVDGKNIGRVFTREDLLMRVWGHKHYGHTRTVDVHIRRLRHKLGARGSNCIHTVNNVGYGFIEPTGSQP